MAYKNPNDERARIARRKHYNRNKLTYFLNNKKKKDEMRTFLIKLKSLPCLDCKQSYPWYVMDFDHRDMDKKSGTINQVLKRGSWRLLRGEVEKCDIICANCHRIRTAKQLGYGLGSGNSVDSKST